MCSVAGFLLSEGHSIYSVADAAEGAVPEGSVALSGAAEGSSMESPYNILCF